ncbi:MULTISPECIES: SLC13 family permease [Ferrimonas]|uniref:SLC13 family permease n=1 Tax=Ferrimonas TaxID=44011 RepID=UPI0004105384|nr:MULTISPECIES: SLC13 family permease [Ferrimonas]USD36480.1 SLC13 family permease [Ferrimonas sp. SCSIO 43195]
MTLIHGQLLALAVSMFFGLVFTRLRPVLLFSGTAIALVLMQQLDVARLLTLAANPAVISLLLLLLVSAGIEKTRLLAWLSQFLFRRSYASTLMRMGAGTMVSSAFLNNTAVVAALMGRVHSNPDHSPSRLLLPLSYAAILGGTLTLVGTSTNLIVNSFLVEAGKPSLALFDFLPVGLVACSVGLVLLVLLSAWLPRHPRQAQQEDPYFIEAKVQPDSPLVGRSVQANGLRALEGLFLAEVVRGQRLISPLSPDTVLEAGDKLVFCGDVRRVTVLQRFRGLTLFASAQGQLDRTLTEVIVSPTSAIVGQTLKSVEFRARFDAAVVAMRRRGERLSGKLGQIPIQAGDVLVLAVGQGFDHSRVSRNFFVIGNAQLSATLTPLQEWIAIGGFVSVLALSAFGAIELVAGLAVLLMLMLTSGVLSGQDVRQRFPFEIWMIITGALAIADSVLQSGLALVASNWLHQLFNGQGVMVAFVGVYLVALILTELMTNNAAAALALPLALGLADAFGVSAMPFVMAVAYGASASFISPFSYQTNLMVMSLGDYRKRDYLRLGLPMSLAYSAAVLLTTPLFFPF